MSITWVYHMDHISITGVRTWHGYLHGLPIIRTSHGFTRVLHGHNMGITRFHMGITWILMDITWASHAYHMGITWVSHGLSWVSHWYHIKFFAKWMHHKNSKGITGYFTLLLPINVSLLINAPNTRTRWNIMLLLFWLNRFWRCWMPPQ